MRKIHKLLLPAIIFMMAIIQVKAQGTAGIDVIPNGGFEKWQDTGQPTGWRIVSSLNPERVQERRPESIGCLLYTSPSPRDPNTSRMPSSA